MIILDIPTRLKSLRKERGLTQAVLCMRMNIPRGRYGSYEEGRAIPSVETLIRFKEFYGFETLDELLGLTSSGSHPVVRKYLCLSEESKKVVDYLLERKL